MLVFSDIHYSGKKDIKKLNKLLDLLKKYDADYITIPGDLLDNDEVLNKDLFVDWIKKLTSISKVIISLGNHDIRKRKKGYVSYYNKDYYDKLNSVSNVYFLNNNSISFDDIYFFGYTQSFEYYYKYKNESSKIMLEEINKYNVSKTTKNKFNVLLMHSPICYFGKIEKQLSSYDLILSGHMHNGIVPPIFDEIFDNDIGLVAPNKSLFPKNARGVLKRTSNLIISSGVTKFSKGTKLFSIFNVLFPMGINYITITKNKELKKEIKYYF